MWRTLLIGIILFYTTILFSQNDSDKTIIRSGEPRGFFIISSLGVLEFISLGVGYQVSEKISITIKGSQTFITGAAMGIPNMGYGLGSKVSYSTKFLLFNSISAEYIAYLGTNTAESKSLKFAGNYFDLNIGRENIYAQGFNIFWAVGICISAVESTDALVSPSLKIGLNFNFQ